MAKAKRKVKLKRSVILAGEHAEKGSVHEMPANEAAALVGDGSAEFHEESADDEIEENRGGVRVHDPLATSREPEIRKVADAPPKAKKA